MKNLSLQKYKYINVHTHNTTLRDDEFFIVEWFTLPLNNQNENLFYSAGIHPWHINENENEQWEILLQQVSKTNCLAIGECGLDKLKGADFDKQIQLFEKQIQLAYKINKPVIVHCVKAFNELLNIKKKYNVRMIVHGFNQSLETAEQLIKVGCYLSYGTSLLNNKSKASLVITKIPIDKLFLENDAKDIAMKTIFEAAANYRNIGIDELARQVKENFNSVFI